MRTSTKMKRKLREEWPEANFKARKDGGSLSTSFTVYTDLIEEPDREKFRELDRKLSNGGLKGKELEEYKKIESRIEKNTEIEKKIHDLLGEFWHIDRDEKTQEILRGGNTYLFVKKWEATKWLD